MPVQKIKSGRVLSPGVNQFVGDRGIIFYDESLGDLRLGDGVTPGGIPLLTGGGGYVLPIASTSTLGGIKVGQSLTIGPDGTLNISTGTAGISNSFRTIVTTGSSNLVASGEDTLELVAGPSISIVTSATSSPFKTVTIAVSNFIGNLDGGYPETIYGGTINIDGGSVL